jgi:thiamine biosynthesis lipoprotein
MISNLLSTSTMKRLIVLIVALVISVTFMLERTFFGVRRQEGSFLAMGGIPVNVVAYGMRRGDFKAKMRLIAGHVESMENVLSSFLPESELAKLNAMGKGCGNFSPLLVDMLKRSRQWYDITGGAFDVTIGPLIELWKRLAEKNKLPTSEEIADAKSRVGMDLVRIEGKSRVCLEHDGMSITLGGIAKGAIMDRAAQVLKANDVPRGLVDAGGDVSSFGDGVFKVGIQDPSSPDKLFGVITLPAGGVVTSGDYERFVTIQGKNYSHIIDPRTGRPADELVSVTIMGPDATNADALATAISVLGKERGIELMNRLPNFRAIIMSHDGSVWMSEDLDSLVELITTKS